MNPTYKNRIATQRVFFTRRNGIHRFVELGPAKVLGGMAKRTAEAKYAARDTVLSVERQYLSCISDTKNLYFEYDAPTATRELPSEGIEKESQGEQQPTVHALPSSEPEATPLTKAIATASIADVPVSVKEITQILVAHKLKRPVKDIQMGRTLKELTGGI